MNPYMKKKFMEQYQQIDVSTGVENASPHKLVSMLYEGVLENIAVAKGAIQRNDLELKAEKIDKAYAIVSGLEAGLDLEAGGEVAENYMELYDYIKRSLVKASGQKNIELLDEIADLVRSLNESWNMIPENMKAATRQQIELLKGQVK